MGVPLPWTSLTEPLRRTSDGSDTHDLRFQVSELGGEGEGGGLARGFPSGLISNQCMHFSCTLTSLLMLSALHCYMHVSPEDAGAAWQMPLHGSAAAWQCHALRPPPSVLLSSPSHFLTPPQASPVAAAAWRRLALLGPREALPASLPSLLPSCLQISPASECRCLEVLVQLLGPTEAPPTFPPALLASPSLIPPTGLPCLLLPPPAGGACPAATSRPHQAPAGLPFTSSPPPHRSPLQPLLLGEASAYWLGPTESLPASLTAAFYFDLPPLTPTPLPSSPQVSPAAAAAWRRLSLLGPTEPLPTSLPAAFYFDLASHMQCGKYSEMLQPYLENFPREK